MEFPVSNRRVQSDKQASSECRPGNKSRGGVTVQFEVAPDPDNQALTARWRRLPEELKVEITRGVAQVIVPPALAALRVKGELIEQTGGYMGETNPGLGVRLSCGKRGIEVARFLGHVFAQQSVLAVSETRRKGLRSVQAIAIHLPDEFSLTQTAALYRRLWSLEFDGQRPIEGHTTAAREMSILNFSGIATQMLKARIDDSLRGEFATEIRTVFTATIAKLDYGYGTERLIWPITSAPPPVLDWHNYLRWKAAKLLRAALAEYQNGELGRRAVAEPRAA
jgi:hypothetical protein